MIYEERLIAGRKGAAHTIIRFEHKLLLIYNIRCKTAEHKKTFRFLKTCNAVASVKPEYCTHLRGQSAPALTTHRKPLTFEIFNLHKHNNNSLNN